MIDCLFTIFVLSQSLLDLKDRFDHFLNNSFGNDRLFKQAISSVSCNCYNDHFAFIYCFYFFFFSTVGVMS